MRGAGDTILFLHPEIGLDPKLPALDALKQTLTQLGIALNAETFEQLLPLLQTVQSFAEAYHRDRLLHVLGAAGTKVRVYGIGWQALAGQTFCIAEGHGAARLIEQRFAAHARYYPSSAHALIGLKLGECQVVVEDLVLLEALAKLPEWRRYARLLPRLADAERELMVELAEAGERDLLAEWARNGRLDQFIRESVDEVAFQAYVLADTLDCH